MYSEKPLKVYFDELSSNSHTPGGGSGVPLVGALSASIACFIINLTKNKKKYTQFESQLSDLAIRAEKLKIDFLPLIDKDCEVLNNILESYRVSNSNPESHFKIIKYAIQFSIDICKMCLDVLYIGLELSQIGNKMLSSDLEIIALLGESSLKSSISNIKININGLSDTEYCNSIQKKCIEMQLEGNKLKDEIINNIQLNF